MRAVDDLWRSKQRTIDGDIVLRHARREKRCSKRRRTVRRSRAMTRGSAAIASSTVSTIAPVKPSSIISGTEPQRKANTGVPQAMDSIIAKPNGRANRQETECVRLPEKLRLLLLVNFADEFNAGAIKQRAIVSRKYASSIRSTLAAILNGT